MSPIARSLLAILPLQFACCAAANAQIQVKLSDTRDSIVELLPVVEPAAELAAELATDELELAAETAEHEEYPRYVSRDPGWPRKPLWDRPGDVNQSASPPQRYCQDDCFRAGWPHCLRKHATCSINSHYYAWYVGGGASVGWPLAKNRSCQDGTWGMDYSLLHKPKLIFLRWTSGRHQGGEGAYETDH